jgi:hypothetical protein
VARRRERRDDLELRDQVEMAAEGRARCAGPRSRGQRRSSPPLSHPVSPPVGTREPRSPEPHRLTFTTPRPTFTPSVLRSSKGKRWTKPTGWGPVAPPAGAASVRGTLFKGSFSKGRQIRSRAGHLYSSTTSTAEGPSLRVLSAGNVRSAAEPAVSTRPRPQGRRSPRRAVHLYPSPSQ